MEHFLDHFSDDIIDASLDEEVEELALGNLFGFHDLLVVVLPKEEFSLLLELYKAEAVLIKEESVSVPHPSLFHRRDQQIH